MKRTARRAAAVILSLVLVLMLSACGSDSAKEEKSIKVGCMYSDSVNDGGFTQAMDEGIANAAEKTGFELIKKEGVPVDRKEARSTIKNFIDQGCKVIVCCSSGYSDAVRDIVDTGRYDDVDILIFAGDYQNGKNVESFFGSMEEARYLSGMACAAVSRSHRLGYVAACRNTEVQIGINAFTLGAMAVDPDIRVDVKYTGEWNDEESERKAVAKLVKAGCDVLTYHADTVATQLAAKNEDVFATGWNTCENLVGEKYVTSAYWNFTGYFTDTFTDIKEGDFRASDKEPFGAYGSIKSGMVKIDDFGERVPSETIKVINGIREKMEEGEFKVFSGEIKYSDGRILCEKGKSLTDKEIWKTDGEVKGVNVI